MALFRNGFARMVAAFALLSLAPPAYAADSRVALDRVEVEAKESFIRLHVDVLDSKGTPVPSLTTMRVMLFKSARRTVCW